VKHWLLQDDDPAEMAATLVSLAARSGDTQRSRIAPKLVAHGDDPPFVAYEFIEGRLLRDVIADLAGGSSPDHPERLIELARESGAMMARFHQAFGPPGPQDRADDRLSGSRLVSRVLELGGVQRTELTALVRSLIDPGPHNLLLDHDDQVVMIDLPGAVVLRPREAEIGMLAHRFGRAVRRSVRSSGSPSRGVARRIAAAVVEGYQNEHPQPLDPRLIEVFIAVSSALYASTSGPSVRSVVSARDVVSDVVWCCGSIVRARFRARSGAVRP
jgi:hypothetical protein